MKRISGIARPGGPLLAGIFADVVEFCHMEFRPRLEQDRDTTAPVFLGTDLQIMPGLEILVEEPPGLRKVRRGVVAAGRVGAVFVQVMTEPPEGF